MRVDNQLLPFALLTVALLIKLCTICMLCLVFYVPRTPHYERLAIRDKESTVLMFDTKK